MRAAGPAGDTIGEGGGGTATVSQLGEPGGVQSTATITQGTSTIDNTATTTLIIPTQLPPQAQPPAPMSPPIFVPQPAPGSTSPVTRSTPAAQPSPRPVPPAVPIQRTVPAPAPAPARPPSRSAELSEGEAVSRVKSFVISSKSYDIPADCVEVRSLGYKNVGYTLNVVDLCGPDPRSLGHWRVDAVTREVFRQSGDGRFLRP
ncbi:MAG: hypothetical protein ABIP63_07210 [Thermoanaerobaculia bacterium]